MTEQPDIAEYARLRNLHRPDDPESLRQAARELQRQHGLEARDIADVLGLNIGAVEQLLREVDRAP